MQWEDWGLIDYPTANQRQLQWVQRIAENPSEERIVFCRHPSLVSLGKATQATDVKSWQGPVFESQRGGRATYHGPQQLVIYPLLNLKNRDRDLHQHLRRLENACLQLLWEQWQIKAEGGRKDATGVWIGNKKLASLGIAVRHWVSYHGMAINLNHDPLAFTGISPCGFSTEQMTCLEEILGQEQSYDDIREKIKGPLQQQWT